MSESEEARLAVSKFVKFKQQGDQRPANLSTDQHRQPDLPLVNPVLVIGFLDGLLRRWIVTGIGLKH